MPIAKYSNASPKTNKNSIYIIKLLGWQAILSYARFIFNIFTSSPQVVGKLKEV